MGIAITLRGFNDLRRTVTPNFFFDGSFSLPILYGLRKYEENLSGRNLTFLQNAPWNSVHFTSSSTCAQISNASLIYYWDSLPLLTYL